MIATYRSLAPPIDIDGPRVRLGLLWGIVTIAATMVGPGALAAVFAPVALAAAGQACRAWRREDRQAYRPVAIGGAVLVTVAASGGSLACVAAAVIAGVASLIVRSTRLGGREYDAVLTAAIALGVGSAAAIVPVVRERLGFSAAVVLLLGVHLADASAFIVGSGARHRWEAPIASAATVGALSVAAAAALAPPFRGATPFVLGAVIAALAPAGPRVASTLLPRPDAFAPGLRRLDGFLAAGPVWAVIAALILDVRY